MDNINRCAEILSKTQRLLVITGAGISAESGISTYRGTNGAYNNNPDLPSIMSAEGLRADRDKFNVRTRSQMPLTGFLPNGNRSSDFPNS